MDRSHKPSSIGLGQPVPSPTVVFNKNNLIDAILPTGESVSIHLFGATVVSWKADGREHLFLSDKAHMDGSKPIRGGIPLVFPVFGAPPQNHATSTLPQHGFARNSTWAFLGKSTSESLGKDRPDSDNSITLDFGLSHDMLSEESRSAWPFEFGLVYSVSLTRDSLETSLKVLNNGSQNFEFQVLMHSYLAVPDISKIHIKNLESKTYIDKTQNASTQTETSPAIPITQETDRIYQALDPETPVVVTWMGDRPLFSITREMLPDTVVWNPWIEKAKGMADFAPEDAYQRMICVESGSVSAFQTLEPGDSWEGRQTIRVKF